MTVREPKLEIQGFEPQKLLGSGGFAEVWLCKQLSPERNVAIKVLHARLKDESGEQNFVAEANVLAVLSSHPAIVTIHETGIASDGRPFFVMEYCSQPNLDQRSGTRPFSVPEMLQTMIRLAGAVATAHISGIIHRDIKPANVLTTDYGWPALADFGIAQLMHDQVAPGSAVSVPWAAPEVLRGGEIDHRADVYGLGATAWTLLTGHSPFEHREIGRNRVGINELMRRVLEDQAPATGRPDVPPALERMLTVALAKDQSDRQQTVTEFARSLQRIEHDLHLPTTHFDTPAATSEGAEVGAEVGQDSVRSHTFDETTRRNERTAFADRTALADRTRLVRHRNFSPDDSTVTPEASNSSVVAPDERTRLKQRQDRQIEDQTVLAGSPPTPRAPMPLTVVTHSNTRIGYDPSVQGIHETQYGVRETRLAHPIRRVPLPQEASNQSQAAETSSTPKTISLRTKFILLGVGTGAVVGGLVVLVWSLLHAGAH